MQGAVTFWDDADGSEAILQVQAASPLCGDERVSGICGAEAAARSLFDPDRPNSCAKKNQKPTSTQCNEIPWSKHAFVRLIGQNNINGRTTLAF
jgi:hypothetical protein